MVKLSEASLADKVNREELGKFLLFYSFADKSNAFIGSKRRLLVFNPLEDELLYLPDTTKVQFEDPSLFAKGDKPRMKASTSVIKRDPKSKAIEVQGKLLVKQTEEKWVLEFKKVGLAEEWQEMLLAHKKGTFLDSLGSDNSQMKPSPNAPNSNTNPLPEENEGGRGDFLLGNLRALVTDPDPKRQSPAERVKPQDNPSSPNTRNDPNARNNPNGRNDSNIRNDSTTRNEPKPITSSNVRNQPIKPNNTNISSRTNDKKDAGDDWNLIFLKNSSQATISDFELVATKVALSKLKQFQDKSEQEYMVFEEGNLLVVAAQNFTQTSRRLKMEFRNYHYIMQATQDKLIVGVPLVCLVELNGFLVQVKARLPRAAKQIKNMREVEYILQPLEEKSKVMGATLAQGNSIILDLTDQYGPNGDFPLLYLDQLTDYLPEIAVPRKGGSAFSVRPQLLFYNINGRVMGGSLDSSKNSKLQTDILNIISQQVSEVADFLSSEDIYVTNIGDLRELLHYRGVNMKLLYKVLTETSNKFVKKYVQTCLAAKVAKDSINKTLKFVTRQNAAYSPETIVEDQIRIFVQGSSSTNSEAWKSLSFEFRNLYGVSLSTHELEGGFFLGCLMTLIPAEYDLGRLNKTKDIFNHSDIIDTGFVKRLLPKAKSYYRYQSQFMETCKYSKTDEKDFRRIVDSLRLRDQPIPQGYEMHGDKKYLLAYLSDFVSPQDTQLKCAAEIYNLVNFEPPSTATIKITLNYLGHLILSERESKNYHKLEEEIERSIDIINYWLGEEHPQICEFYDKLSGFKINIGEVEEGLAILERSKEIAEKTEAKNPSKLGSRYYILGEQYLKSGRKKEALLNLQRARESLSGNPDKEHEFALTLMKLSSLDLNAGRVGESITQASLALTAGESSKLKDRYLVKIYEILCRGHEIRGDKDDLRKVSLKCAKRFDGSLDPYVFSEMVKISLTGAFAKMSQARAKSALMIARKAQEQGQVKDQSSSIEELMRLSKSGSQSSIEKLLLKIEMADKVWGEMDAKRPLSAEFNELVNLIGLATGAVGIDFLEGLEAQKQYE